MNEIKAIIFDLGDVLFPIDQGFVERVARHAMRFVDAPDPTFSFRSFLNESGLWQKFETSIEYEAQDFHKDLVEQADLDLGLEEFQEAWISCFHGVNEELIRQTEILEQSHKFQLAILSNINSLHWEAFKEWGYLAYLKAFKSENTFLSFELGCMKPQTEIYETACGILKVAPRECFFVDNIEINVKAFQKLGAEGFVFNHKNLNQANADLIKEFEKLLSPV